MKIKTMYITFTLISSIFVTAFANNTAASDKSLNLETAIESLYNELFLAGKLDIETFEYAMIGYMNLNDAEKLQKKSIITIIDFQKPSTEERLFVVDLKNKKVLYSTLVAHGQNTGANFATNFSNVPGSLQSSLGFFVTAETYFGKHGYSMRLQGADPYFNDRARERAIVVHGANYATQAFVIKHGRLGRSWGCPALPPQLTKPIIDTIKDGSALFVYYPDRKFLSRSLNLNIQNAMQHLFEEPSLLN